MSAEPTGPRHAAPLEPLRPRTILLPSLLLVAAGAAFGGLAVLPAAADVPAPRVTAAEVLAPVELAAVEAPMWANATLYAALSKGAVVANTPVVVKPPAPAAPPAPEPPRPAPAHASRSRPAPAPETVAETVEGVISKAKFARPGLGRLTSPYGRRWGRLHGGIDLASGIGSPIRAAAGGTVLSAGNEGAYGKAVRIRLPDGTVNVYAHLSAFLVRSGQRVAGGEQIAREGNTGRSTGPHLHFEVRVNDSPINPVPWLSKRGITI